jgi:hypothetical protein
MHSENYAKIISVFVYLSEEDRFKDVHKNSASFAHKIKLPHRWLYELPRDQN